MITKVQFMYYTGIRRSFVHSAVLSGSWDDAGHWSDDWKNIGMTRTTGPDGCPAFTAQLDLDESDPATQFSWGVWLTTAAGAEVWGIFAETTDMNSSAHVRTFRIGASDAATQTYYLNQSRRMGAQCYNDGIHFSVWAPNARNVQVWVGNLWESPGGNATAPTSSLIDPGKVPALKSSNRYQVAGGYLTDAGQGACPAWSPFHMTRDEAGVWNTDPKDPAFASFARFAHVPYMFRVEKDDSTVVFKTDLYSRCQIGSGTSVPHGEYNGLTTDLDGSVSCSVVVDPDRVTELFFEQDWPEQNWLCEDDFWEQVTASPNLPSKLEDLVIYELHLGALGIQRGSARAGTLQDALDYLDHLQLLGVNCVELLPLSEFGGITAGWGYGTSQYHAVEYSGGGRDQYKWFVRECHHRGIAVILDVVYNHYSPNAGRSQWMYDTNAHERNSYYWYEGFPSSYANFDRAATPDKVGQGGYVDNDSSGWAPRYWEEHVRNLMISSAIALAEEFHVDGFRVDQTTSIRNYNRLHADGCALQDANVAGTKFLRELTRTLRFIKPGIFLIAEDHANWSGVVQPPDDGGLGFDASWYADFYHHLIGDTDKGLDYAKLLKSTGVTDGPLAMEYFAGALQATSGGGKIVYHESHDEAGNGTFTDRTLCVAVNGAPLVAETRCVAEDRVRFVAAVTLFSAGTPMFLFGEEVGAQKKFLYGNVLQNREDYVDLRKSYGAKLFTFYKDAIRLRLFTPALKGGDLKVIYTHNGNRVIAFLRGQGALQMLIVGTLSDQPFASGYEVQSSTLPDGRWKEVFNTDAGAYGGANTGNKGGTLTSANGRFACVLPARGIVMFTLLDQASP